MHDHDIAAYVIIGVGLFVLWSMRFGDYLKREGLLHKKPDVVFAALHAKIKARFGFMRDG